MSVEFEEPKFNFDRKGFAPEKKNTPIINLIMKMGIAKTPTQVNTVMIVICVLCLGASITLAKIYLFK